MATATASVSNQFDYSALNGANSKKKSDIEQQQDRFLKLLVKQLQSQDPMNPMDSAETTSQMAQINTVTGIEKLNQTMGTMMSLYAGTQVMQAAGLIGKEVLSPGKEFHFDGKSAELRLEAPAALKSATLTISDKNGKAVATIPYGALPPGGKAIEWDGKKADGSVLPAGDYTVTAKGVQAEDGKEIALTMQTWQAVKSVEFGANGVVALLANGGKADFGSIVQIQDGKKAVAA
ncbi:flagellar hook assembly protein FlgD [Chitinilyticum litopenaei]|uniref:flagellar hook assembly protein FlgD n=1 Tax=Chitinilyticum litopenaei TaxID=1121276 RepID=UPI000420FAAC|nr:flagellar hook assembly protein FlgD [Chitinilyticum litopenaei]